MHPWKSTRLHLSLIAMTLMTLAFFHSGTPANQFGEFCMGLLGAAAIYSGGRTAEKFAKPAQPPT